MGDGLVFLVVSGTLGEVIRTSGDLDAISSCARKSSACHPNQSAEQANSTLGTEVQTNETYSAPGENFSRTLA
jgi:hypothetical protein